MKTLEQEALEYEKSFVEPRGYEAVDFTAGATSKYVEAEKLKFAIEQLKNVDFNMCKQLRLEAINFNLSQEEATYKWGRTKWHLEIMSSVKDLEQQLKELES